MLYNRNTISHVAHSFDRVQKRPDVKPYYARWQEAAKTAEQPADGLAPKAAAKGPSFAYDRLCVSMVWRLLTCASRLFRRAGTGMVLLVLLRCCEASRHSRSHGSICKH